jgi:hypothetical protein
MPIHNHPLSDAQRSALNHVASDWMHEEMAELVTALKTGKTEAALDAYLDMFGILVSALNLSSSLELENAFKCYVDAQHARGRDLSVFHHRAIAFTIQSLVRLSREEISVQNEVLITRAGKEIAKRRGAEDLTNPNPKRDN